MKKKTFLVYSGYIWTKTLLGLTVHPYLSIKETMRRPILLPVIFTPILALIILFIAAKIGSFLISIDGLLREMIALGLSTVLFTMLLWQILLVYLLGSFIIARWRND